MSFLEFVKTGVLRCKKPRAAGLGFHPDGAGV